MVHAALVASVLTHAKAAPVAPTSEDSHAGARPRRRHDWAAAILWGVAVAVLTTAVWVGARRTRRGRRALVLGFGLAVWLVVVFFFFQAVAPLLPASY